MSPVFCLEVQTRWCMKRGRLMAAGLQAWVSEERGSWLQCRSLRALTWLNFRPPLHPLGACVLSQGRAGGRDFHYLEIILFDDCNLRLERPLSPSAMDFLTPSPIFHPSNNKVCAYHPASAGTRSHCGIQVARGRNTGEDRGTVQG